MAEYIRLPVIIRTARIKTYASSVANRTIMEVEEGTELYPKFSNTRFPVCGQAPGTWDMRQFKFCTK
jgi:hypothetical protein